MTTTQTHIRPAQPPAGGQQIALNMFPLVDEDFSFSVFRREAVKNEKSPGEGIRRHALPPPKEAAGSDVPWPKFWVSFEEAEGFEPFSVHARANPHLTTAFLFQTLIANAKKSELEHFVQAGFVKKVAFVTSKMNGH